MTQPFSSGNQNLQVASSSRSKKKTRRSPRKPPAEWENVREPFTRLWVEEDLSLDEVMTHLKEEKNFYATYVQSHQHRLNEHMELASVVFKESVEATFCIRLIAHSLFMCRLPRGHGTSLTISRPNQWKWMIKKWKLDKKAKGHEMAHIIKIQKERLQLDPPKRTAFEIRGRPVDDSKIERYKREHDQISTPSSRKVPACNESLNNLLTFAATPSAISVRTLPSSPREPFEGEWDRDIDWEGLASSNPQLAQMNTLFGYLEEGPSSSEAYPPSDEGSKWVKICPRKTPILIEISYSEMTSEE